MLNLAKADLNRNVWDKVRYPYAHTLAEVMFPNVNFCIVHGVPSKSFTARHLIERLPNGYHLDFATSGGKKTGDYIASSTGDVGAHFCHTVEEVLAYAGLLLTPCWGSHPVKLTTTVQVVEDGELGTGDCHGKANNRVYAALNGHADKAGQFRLAAYEPAILAKGTIVREDMDVGLVLPVSSFKSTFKPAPGFYVWEVFLGVVAWSEVRPTKFSWQVLQWFSWEAIEQDILPHALHKAEALALAGEDPRQLVKELKVDANDIDLEFIQIAEADTNGVLTRHPWFMRRARKLLQRRFKDLALGGGRQFAGLMGLPDDSLPFGVVATNSLPKGKYIFTRYPLRYWGDLIIVKNVGTGSPVQGVVYMSHETAALLGGDFDGDYFQMVSVHEFPALTEEIRSWHDKPQAEILKVKQRRATPISQEALASQMLANAESKVGIIALLIARAHIFNRDDLVPQLAQELQISVDKFKYNLEHDDEFLTMCHDALPGVSWLKDRDHADAYLTRPMLVADGEGTVGNLVQAVNGLWAPVEDHSRPLTDFTLVFGEKPAEEFMTTARKANRRFGALMSAISEIKDLDVRKDERAKIFRSIREWSENHKAGETMMVALWHAVHTEKSNGTGSLPFHAFPWVVCDLLPRTTPDPSRATIVGLGYWDWKEELGKLQGIHPVTFEAMTYKGMVRTKAVVDNRTIGLVSKETPVVPGTWPMTLEFKGAAVYAAIA